MRRTNTAAAPEMAGDVRIQEFLDMIAPSVIKFETDHFICGNTFRCVWALREYPTSTDEQAILSHLGEKDGVTLRIYTRHVTPMEEKKIISNAANKNRMDRSNTNDLQQNVYMICGISRGHIPLLVGGTGLYISSVVYGYQFEKELQDSEFRKELEEKSVEELQKMLPREALEYFNGNRSDLYNKRRLIRVLERLRSGEKLEQRNQPIFNTLQLGVRWKKEILHQRIEERLMDRLNKGMVRRYGTT